MSRILVVLLLLLKTSGSGIAASLSEDSITSRFKEKWYSPVSEPSGNRTWLLGAGTSLLYAGSISWLYTQWYKQYDLEEFHWFDDSGEWEDMDKYGHIWDTYSIAKPMSHCFQWAGYDVRRSAAYGTGIAYMFQTTVEVLDGFSSGWGFSMYDVAANTVGAAAFLSQELAWQEQRIVLKYSFHATEYAQYRPDVLGKTLPERILKDYNGLTYWASVNPAAFMHEKPKSFPAWLSIAVGLGAEGMTGGRSNPTSADGKPLPGFERYRQYYLGVDIDLARIRTRHRWLSGLFKVVNIVRIPAPALELSPGRKPRWHALYF